MKKTIKFKYRVIVGVLLNISLAACQKEKFSAAPPAAAAVNSPIATSPTSSPRGGGLPPLVNPPAPLVVEPVFPQMPVPEWVGEGFDVEFFNVYALLLETQLKYKRIITLGTTDEYSKEAYAYQKMFIWFLYNHGYRNIGFEQTEFLKMDSADLKVEQLRTLKHKARVNAKNEIVEFIHRLDQKRLPNTTAANIFSYKGHDLNELNSYLASRPTDEKLIFIGNDLTLSRNPMVLEKMDDPPEKPNLGFQVNTQFPGQVLNISMLTGGGQDSSLVCESEVCRIESNEEDISHFLNEKIEQLEGARRVKYLLMPSAQLPGEFTEDLEFLVGNREFFAPLKMNSDLVFYARRIHALPLDQ